MAISQYFPHFEDPFDGRDICNVTEEVYMVSEFLQGFDSMEADQFSTPIKIESWMND
jgi:hypothetical protein